MSDRSRIRVVKGGGGGGGEGGRVSITNHEPTFSHESRMYFIAFHESRIYIRYKRKR